jgi:RHS repeat-associated protein
MRPLIARALFPILPILALAGSASTSAAQATGDIAQGFTPYQSFHGGDIDSVNLSNGNVILRIPLLSYPQRGSLKLSFSFLANSKSAHTIEVCSPVPPKNCTYGWVTTAPVVVDDASVSVAESLYQPGGANSKQETMFAVVTSDGAQHPLVGSETGQITSDATGFWSNSSYDAAVAPPTVVITREGVRNFLTGSVNREDPNGNQILVGTSGYTDTMGRAISPFLSTTGGIPGSSTTNFSGCTGALPIASATIWTVPGLSGGTMQFKFCQVSVAINIPAQGQARAQTGTQPSTQSIVLPNGTAWTFAYDNYGDISQVTLPTGGTIAYTYETAPAGECQVGDNLSRYATSRTVNANDGAGAHTWQYSFSGVTTVTDPLSNQAVHTFTSFGTPISCFGFETLAQYYQGSNTAGTLLKTVQTDYENIGAGNPVYMSPGALPIRVTTTWPNNQVTKVETDYDSQCQGSPCGNVIARREYDYGNGAPGSLLRTTAYQYEAFINSTYLANNLLSLPSSVQATNGSGTQVAYTTYGYDAYALGSSGMGSGQQHDTAPADGAQRGNQTSVQRWLNTTGAHLTSTAHYFDTGKVQTATDPAGNSTTFAYSATYEGAYLTTVTNALTQTTTDTYDFNTGLLTSTTDPNNQTRTFTYDSSWRPSSAGYPDGGQTSYCYSDVGGSTCTQSGPPFTVTVTRKINSSLNKMTGVLFDGLGRQVQTATTNGEPTPYDQVDTCYDANGRVTFTSYPYQGTGLSTPSCTRAGDSLAYDALGRTTSIAHADSSTILTSYTGRATSVSDEGNGIDRVQRVSQIDGLGQLTSLCEVTNATQMGTANNVPAACGQDVAATGFLTSYTYDALGNLLTVAQPGLNSRSFTYDSLSRLLSASNPESGTTTYNYDSDTNCAAPNSFTGDLVSKVDARGIRTCMQYDALHRLLSKAYSDGTTPTVTLNYDQTSALGVTGLINTIGRASSSYVTSGSTKQASEVFSYDPMGRVQTNSQCTPQECTSSTVFPVAYTYDLNGDLATATNGAGVTLTYAYNAGARPTSVTSSLNDSNHPPSVLSAIHYNAVGGLLSAAFGNGISETRTYDARLRLSSITAGTVYSAAIPTTGGYAPNGDILSANDSANGNWNYTYDDFNRLANSAPSGQSWSYSYTYDRYGNRWQQNLNGTGGSGPTSNLTLNGNNQIAPGNGVSYDAAGNVTADPANTYTYDAENRIVSTTNTHTGVTTTYTYDASGQRVEKISGGLVTQYVYDLLGHAIAEFSASGVWDRGEIYVGGRHLATYVNSTTYFIHSDWLGTERVRSNVTGTGCERITSFPFGDNMVTSGSCSDISTRHFTSKERDTESSNDYFGARYNSSSVGRFLSPDPLLNSGRPWDPQSWNRYAYVRNNPLVRVDPTGLYDLVNNCNSGDKKCNNQFKQNASDLKKGLADLQKKVDKMKDGPEKQRLEASLAALGTEGDNNGVSVAFGTLSKNKAATTDFSATDSGQVSAKVTFDPNKIIDTSDYAVAAAHEGTHIEDFLIGAVNDYIANGSLPALSDFSKEYRGYQTSIFAASALGMGSFSRSYDGTNYILWNGNWAQVDKNITNYVTKFHDENGVQTHPETSPHNPWPN